MKRYIIFMVISASVTCMGVMNAQETIDKEIVVVKPYQPSLSDANKVLLGRAVFGCD